jgi:biotin synthase
VTYVEKLKEDVLSGYQVTKNDCIMLANELHSDLYECANEIRKFFCTNEFDICTIVNGKSGRCSEDCKFCAQSSHYQTYIDEFPMLSGEEILAEAKSNYESGVNRFSIVTSGRSLTSSECDTVCECYELLHDNCGIKLCASHGLLNYEQFVKLKQAGVTRYHNNIETSRRYFPYICTTHTFDDKINAIKSAQKAGLEVCSGIIIGLGETFEDRIDMAFELKNLNVKTIPINILNPIKGTPFENNETLSDSTILLTIALFRFIIPDAFIRLAGGRGLLADKGKQAFLSGANAAISGDMLTTVGIDIKSDIELIKLLGYSPLRK